MARVRKIYIDGKNTCTKCSTSQPLENFSKVSRRPSGHKSVCKSCESILYYTTKKTSKSRAAHLKSLYGMSLADYDDMLTVQNFKCKICTKDQIQSKRYLCVDHNHETGEIRGLLCDRCNQALGLIKENFDTALNLAKYIQQDQGVI